MDDINANDMKAQLEDTKRKLDSVSTSSKQNSEELVRLKNKLDALIEENANASKPKPVTSKQQVILVDNKTLPLPLYLETRAQNAKFHCTVTTSPEAV